MSAEVESMTKRLSDDELARIEGLATAALDYGGDAQELGEFALALIAEVRAAREREASWTVEFSPGHINDRSVVTAQLGTIPHGYMNQYIAECGWLLRRLVGPWEPVPEGDDDDQQ